MLQMQKVLLMVQQKVLLSEMQLQVLQVLVGVP